MFSGIYGIVNTATLVNFSCKIHTENEENWQHRLALPMESPVPDNKNPIANSKMPKRSFFHLHSYVNEVGVIFIQC